MGHLATSWLAKLVLCPLIASLELQAKMPSIRFSGISKQLSHATEYQHALDTPPKKPPKVTPKETAKNQTNPTHFHTDTRRIGIILLTLHEKHQTSCNPPENNHQTIERTTTSLKNYRNTTRKRTPKAPSQMFDILPRKKCSELV